MKDYIVKVERHITARDEEEAAVKFWELIDNQDYYVAPEIREEK